MLAAIPRQIRLQPSITSLDEGRVARLDGEGVHEEAHEDNVALGSIRVRELVGREALLFDESGVDVVKHVGPDLTDLVNLSESAESGVAEGVGCTEK